MHVSSSFPTSDRTIRWIENLADQESAFSEGEGSYDLCSTKDEILASETVSFLNELKYHFEYMVRLFNKRLSDEKLQVRLTLNGTPAEGLNLQRNDIFLQVASKNPGSIHLNCMRKSDGIDAGSVLTTGLIEGSYTTFHEIQWTFLGERVSSEKAACHFFTEFLQLSRNSI